MSASRRRLDEALVELRLAPTRSRARALVMAGKVQVDGVTASKAGMAVTRGAAVEVLEPPRFVGRGGDKLAAALDGTGLRVRGRVCMDVGASTGGFTDCLLQRGARQVVAVDVGYGQLDWSLRRDERVVVVERTNARYLDPADLAGAVAAPDLAVVDVSFIGALKVLPAVAGVCAPRADALVLVKPQFECGPERVGTGGVVRAAGARHDAVAGVAAGACELGWTVLAAVPSPVRGAAGNWECFLHLRRPPTAGGPAPEEVLDALEVPDDGVPEEQPS